MILFFLGLSERQAAQEIFAVLLLFFHGEEGNGIAQKLPAGRVYQSDPLLAVFQMGFHDLFCSGVDPLYLAGMAERKLHLQDSA